ncbi:MULTISPECIES: alpha/beta hydrolase [Saliphagus]|uniref:Prolyl oligopeptidase family serine peptidase n=1 Tax=Saliphagus infecundisoli TaxID=1849069 RepID=A0ABD5QGV9_9EURY|nr:MULTISPECIES: alpha/beta hydrolase [Saliphagus]
MTDTDSVTVHDGITYADRDGDELKLDLYVPPVEYPPLVVYVHGGGWVAETRENVPEPERYAAEWGVAIASVSYRLQEVPDGSELSRMFDPSNPTPRGTFPDHFVDVKAGIRWLRAHADDYGYDAERVAAWGASAGGHLASLAGVVDDVLDLGDAYADDVTRTVAPGESGAIQAVVSWYGVSDVGLAAEGGDGLMALLMGGSRAEYPERYEGASPVAHVTADSPPILLMHGREDEVVGVEQSRRFFDALAEAGVDAVSYELHGLNHVWADDVESIDSERTAMALLTGEPTPAQSVHETTHATEGGTLRPLIPELPPAGPDAIRQFLEETIG